ncbi:hypothetical protein [Actinomyces sp. 565]|uniref:hypothetical protein n=1 Tax=Actinomyces sp. 565 TaxID=2057794 RepID=UPI0013A6F46E|nr:hypothetical protein [Actinomyces sp. 565]NDR53660.1 hypothetical protein [Actinomyces sp. 565]
MTAPELRSSLTRRADAARMDRLRRPLDLCALVLTGAPAWRRAAAQTHRDLTQPLPLTCRIVVVPLVPACGATTVALQLTGALTRARRAPALLLSASPGPASAADQLPFSRSWPLADPVPAAVPPAESGPVLRGAAGCGPDGLTSCLRVTSADMAPLQAWHRARRELGHFFDTCLTEFGLLSPAELAEIAQLHHAIVLVSPARRREVERSRILVGRLNKVLNEVLPNRPAGVMSTEAGAADGLPGTAPAAPGLERRSPVVLHAVVATSPGHPLIPRLHPDEVLVPYDTALGRPGPTPLRRPTGFAFSSLAARAVDAAARSAQGTARTAAGGEA